MNNDMFGKCGMTQFVGVGVCDTIGLYIANIDDDLRKQMNIPEKFHSVGLIGSRTGAGAQIQAVDDAVKATSTEVISIEIPRDTKGWGGHGNFIIIGGETPADVKRAVELALEYIDINAGEIYISEAGHMEFQYSARCGEAINKAFDVQTVRLCMCVTCSDWYGNRRYCVKICRCRIDKNTSSGQRYKPFK